MTNKVAVIAAHPDDEVLGCGGTIARMAQEGCEVNILLIADGETSRRSDENSMTVSTKIENRNISANVACKILGCASVEILGLPDNRLDGLDRLDLVQVIENFIQKYSPLTIFTHHAGDVNIDHRVVHDAVIAACRPLPNYNLGELLFFETPSSTEWRPPSSHWAFSPNFFVNISDTLQKKLEALNAYQEELREFPHPRSLKAIESLAQWRGASVGVKAAEAFILGRKIIK
ncbi:MAG: PIG-L family deacetylase [Deltaproteobacteria bacterium]|nr:MAG: PIG-L family deacetylase [Deltaproteobacteria bacterium]